MSAQGHLSPRHWPRLQVTRNACPAATSGEQGSLGLGARGGPPAHPHPCHLIPLNAFSGFMLGALQTSAPSERVGREGSLASHVGQFLRLPPVQEVGQVPEVSERRGQGQAWTRPHCGGALRTPGGRGEAVGTCQLLRWGVERSGRARCGDSVGTCEQWGQPSAPAASSSPCRAASQCGRRGWSNTCRDPEIGFAQSPRICDDWAGTFAICDPWARLLPFWAPRPLRPPSSVSLWQAHPCALADRAGRPRQQEGLSQACKGGEEGALQQGAGGGAAALRSPRE